MSIVILVVGYAMAVPVCVRLVPVLRERRTRWFAVLQVGTALIVLGHWLAERPSAVAANVFFFVAFWVAWFLWPRSRPA